jgi:type I restriction enzyme R subunit
VTELLKELHRIVNEAIRTQAPGEDRAEGLTFDLSKIDLERLREEFARKVRRKATTIQDIRDIVEKKLAEMLARNPTRMDYQRKYEEIVADYNREKDRTTIEETFRRLVELVNSLDEEQKRATREGLREDELALFDLLQKEGIDKATRERVKQASRELLAAIKARLAELDRPQRLAQFLGSRSNMATLSPASRAATASEVARLLLPHPPLCVANTMMRIDKCIN